MKRWNAPAPVKVTVPASRESAAATRRPSVPPVSQNSFSARLYSTCDSASVRMPKKMRVWRTQI